jgi:hypothetical protein
VGLFFVKTAGNVIATDDFNRADGDLGSNWDYGRGVGDLEIISNQAGHSTSGQNVSDIWVADTFDDDQWVQSDVTLGTNSNPNLLVRSSGQGASNNSYEFYWTNSGVNRIWRITNNSGTLISDSGGNPTSGTHTMRFEVVGSQLTTYIDGVETATVSDSNHTTGRPGIGAYYSGTTPTHDNVSVGDWTEAATPPASITGGIKVGVGLIMKPIKFGASWAIAKLKRWNGSAWVETT